MGSMITMHADYPHFPGFLYGCLACEYGPCQCDDSSDGCVSVECQHGEPEPS